VDAMNDRECPQPPRVLTIGDLDAWSQARLVSASVGAPWPWWRRLACGVVVVGLLVGGGWMLAQAVLWLSR
jgi:hypothetical protein